MYSCPAVQYCRHRSRSNSKVFKQLDLDLPVSEMYLLFPCVWRRSPVTDPGFARGDANLGGALTCYSIWHNFAKNCMKNETNWIGGGALLRSVDPPLLSVMMLRGICRLVILDLPSVLITLWSCNSKLVSFITPSVFHFPREKAIRTYINDNESIDGSLSLYHWHSLSVSPKFNYSSYFCIHLHFHCCCGSVYYAEWILDPFCWIAIAISCNFIYLMVQAITTTLYHTHHNTRKHSGRMPTACLLTVYTSYWTSLNMSGWGRSLFSEAQVEQVWTCLGGWDPVKGGAGLGPVQWFYYNSFTTGRVHVSPPPLECAHYATYIHRTTKCHL